METFENFRPFTIKFIQINNSEFSELILILSLS